MPPSDASEAESADAGAQSACELAFAKHDVDGSGTLGLEEVKAALVELNMRSEDRDVAKLFAYLDIDGSGELSWEEFQTLTELDRAMREAERALISFWLIRGGGEAGDEAISTWFQQDSMTQTLDAQGVGALIRGQLGVPLDPVCDTMLLDRLTQASEAQGSSLLSEKALKAWLRRHFPLFQLQQMLLGLDLHLILAKALIGADPTLQDAFAHLKSFSRDEVQAHVSSANEELAGVIFRVIQRFQEGAERSASSSNAAAGLKFAGDLGSSAGPIFEGKFESTAVFDQGLDRYLGVPDPKVWQHIC